MGLHIPMNLAYEVVLEGAGIVLQVIATATSLFAKPAQKNRFDG